MKKQIIFFAILSIALVSCKEKATSKIKPANLENAKERDAEISKGSAVIGFDKTEYDFGTITEGDLVNGTFKVYNKGKTDLVITNARASCGCTVPEWPKEAIKPGDSAQVKFKFNSRFRRGKQHKTITLQTNTEKVTEVLQIKGFVEPIDIKKKKIKY